MAYSTNLTNDRFGYSCYAFVFPAPPDIAGKVAAIERASGMTRAKIPAHVTVKGTFHEIKDLDQVRALARGIIKGTGRFWISFEASALESDSAGAGLAVEIRPEMERLHDALVTAFRPIATTVYPDDPYKPHMTFYQDATEDGVKSAAALASRTEFGRGFEATVVDLMGRRGPAFGGRWELIERFPLS
ncbi:MAG: 2'-5' RNA ligase family protein [Chloroflexi bacterium]|nr:2'-5' RNA ligase family protein [Chloroflexota bacterium]